MCSFSRHLNSLSFYGTRQVDPMMADNNSITFILSLIACEPLFLHFFDLPHTPYKPLIIFS